ncbi:hypothetical protein FKR48_10615, partial [Neisseria meningitidis]|nr:hypothetical protein [Neisseria meningitidis]
AAFFGLLVPVCGVTSGFGFGFSMNSVVRAFWIPAFAGMTVGGVSVFSDKVLLRCVAGFPPARE